MSEFGIDFDLASAKWRANKISGGNGTFKYVCNYILLNEDRCCNTRLSSHKQYCKKHLEEQQARDKLCARMT